MNLNKPLSPDNYSQWHEGSAGVRASFQPRKWLGVCAGGSNYPRERSGV